MSKSSRASPDGGAGGEPRPRNAPSASDWLGLAAAPTFAAMALSTAVLDGRQPAMLCAAAQGGSPLSGMVLMYLLMAAFHLSAWLRLMSGGGPRPSSEIPR